MPIKPHPLAGPPRAVHTLVAFAAACFAGTLVLDIVYWRSMAYVWETFSVWLLTAGLIVAVFAVLAGVADYAVNRRRGVPLRWLRVVAGAIVIVLSIVNAFVHSRDGYTAVVPTGLTLSAIVFVIMLVTAIVSSIAQRPRAGEIV
ncbi:DUF2231 domain-containing protein [soil metagenome]